LSAETARPRLGISACLLGRAVRYDGGHKREPFLADRLVHYVDYLPLCPETAIGLGSPRLPIQLVGDPDQPRVLGVDNANLDVTEALRDYARRQLDALTGLSGCVLKRGSPSCGMGRVKVYDPSRARFTRSGRGAFAQILMQGLPLLPVEEEDRLRHARLRENFVARVYVYWRWLGLLAQGPTLERLRAFHLRHRYLLMLHSRTACRRLDGLLDEPFAGTIEGLTAAYIAGLMRGLRRPVGRARQLWLLHRILDHLQGRGEGVAAPGLAASIEAYGRGEIPLAVPIGLLRLWLRDHPDPSLQCQHYLDPYPDDLALRDAI